MLQVFDPEARWCFWFLQWYSRVPAGRWHCQSTLKCVLRLQLLLLLLLLLQPHQAGLLKVEGLPREVLLGLLLLLVLLL